MAVITLCSASGAPGVTTMSVALAMNWPRPVLLVEADPRVFLVGYGASASTLGATRAGREAARGVLTALGAAAATRT